MTASLRGRRKRGYCGWQRLGLISVCGNRAVFPGAWSRWEINTRLATPAQKRQGICHRTKNMPPDQDDATILVISGIWVNQEEGSITKQSKIQTKGSKYLWLWRTLVLTVFGELPGSKTVDGTRETSPCIRKDSSRNSPMQTWWKLIVSIFQYSRRSLRNFWS